MIKSRAHLVADLDREPTEGMLSDYDTMPTLPRLQEIVDVFEPLSNVVEVHFTYGQTVCLGTVRLQDNNVTNPRPAATEPF